MTVQKYYSSGSTQIAVRTLQGEEDMLQWLLPDHLGSTSTTANADGSWNSTLQYSAFGEIRASSGITSTEFRYTGQLRQAELGLYYYVARWYDPEIAHFVQADTVITNPSANLAWDRYSYVDYNPIIYSDPSGHMRSREDSYFVGYSSKQASTTQMVYQEHKLLKTLVNSKVISDLEALARLSDFSARVNKTDTKKYVQDLGATLTGHTENAWENEIKVQAQERLQPLGIGYNPGVVYHDYYADIRGENELMQGGYASVFKDTGKGKNQAHHFWFYVQVGYESGFMLGVVGNILHETVLGDSEGKSYQDYALGVEGALIGSALSWGTIKPSEVGDWMRNALSPNSYSSQYWMNPGVYYGDCDLQQ